MQKELDLLKSGAEIKPPWVVFPGSIPSSTNQGNIEEWMGIVWLPFWKALTREQRLEYIDRWNAPKYDWRELLLAEHILEMYEDP